MKYQKNFHKSEWAKKIKENADFYEFFRQKLVRIMDRLPAH